ncbi:MULTISPECIES: DNA-processing protein DprA [Staphylococcus]|uniref:DNA-processing protein DprA n=1 Tax=Staphylococcus TaxID=1279 RepID=UPI0001EF4ED3|nr:MULTISPECIES: DNA-processing protein DprA [Staphylococcus]EFS17335.1 DNA protecting protein DprA [Staphylococcus capitis C87]MBC3048520.1 DNA-protecting protein DprA [Staphylococcus capitis]MBC3068694.1 DNA-protecting protein DprA [Staphylococcus capitis]MBC3070878.1 DNA-protecting protein DprA [Staphylococcus capitis]MBC3081614.1 DNA-protecting protein DprA [Staphylococcus capitis]
MIQHILLKLYWANFTTTQIHQFIKDYPEVISESPPTQKEMIEDWTIRQTTSTLKKKFNLFKSLDTEVLLQEMSKKNLKFLTYFDKNYPQLLKEIYDFPYIIFYKGNKQLFNYPHTLAVIGSRKSTSYTTQALEYLFPSFKQLKMTIISGLAYGADSVAHQVALKNQLPTIGVLGFGHSYHYPKSTFKTRESVEREGLVISEYPPHSPISRYKFPERNRLISGLARGLLITEAEEISGSQITVDCALEQNRNVYVLPGSMFNPMTKSNLLRLQEGAQVVLDESSILSDYNF